MLDLLFAAATPSPVVPTPTTPYPGTQLDFFQIIMWPFKWIVEAILVFWHWIFTAVGLPADAGLTWVLSIIGLVVVVRSALIPLFVLSMLAAGRFLGAFTDAQGQIVSIIKSFHPYFNGDLLGQLGLVWRGHHGAAYHVAVAI